MDALAKPLSTKDQLFHILSHQWPQTVKQLHSALQKEFANDLSYQAVHKLLQGLEEEKTVQKNGANWQLNPNWLQQQEKFFQETLQRYSGNKNKYHFDPHYEGTQTFEFDSFTDLCVETAKLLTHKQLNSKPEPFYCILEYGWWSLKFKFEHLELLYEMIKSCPASRHIIRKKTPFGEWIQRQYARVGGVGAPLGTSIDIQEDIFIHGDYIMEITISEEGKKLIEHYWTKWKTLDAPYLEFGLKPEPKINSTVKITKNPSLAQFMKKELEKYFEK